MNMMADPAPIPAEQRKELRRQAIWLSLALWAFTMVLLWYTGTVRNAGMNNGFDWWLLRLFWMVTAFVLGWIVFRLLIAIVERTRIGPIPGLIALVLVFGVFHSWLNAVVFFAYAGEELLFYRLLQLILYWLHFQYAWGILILTLVINAQAKAEREARADAQREGQAAQFDALKFQIHPHFLFNTLGAVAALVSEREFAKAEQVVRKLAAFIRSGLRRDTHADVSLTDEITELQLYLEIERVRFDGRFDFTLDIAEDVSGASIPSSLLQPLLENSVKYAVAQASDPVAIRLSASREGTEVYISLSDNGPGINESTGLGTGERNVRNRLVTRFGESIQFESGSRATGPSSEPGYEVRIRFPYEAWR
jgi:signal transduction histidine kinase